MDYQQAFNLALGVGAFLGAFVLSKIWGAIERLDNEARQLPKIYVAKEDYKSDIHEIKGMLRQIFDMLALKADK
tara:strand:- start:105 stop:326 length:222 start_codon:yes stop_codon:yes gene_type:complete